jgi:hypothetical protein
MLALVAVAVVSQVDLTSQLGKGPLVLVEEGATGRFDQSTGFILADAPVEVTWGLVTRFEAYQAFMPRVTESEVERRAESEAKAPPAR